MFKSSEKKRAPIQPRVYQRSEHNISRSQVSENALKVLYRLKKAGYDAYLVGGCVRDLLLGREPKDFDVVTNAHPEQVKTIFRNCRLIGRRFRLAHVHFGSEIVEVATFRGSAEGELNGDRILENGRVLRDNIYGTLEEDVWRRDFSVNALYYNIRDFSVVDLVSGMEDHANGVLRLVGDPVQRYREDPVRMLRAVRFATKLGFSIHPSCEAPIRELAKLLREIPSARLYDETLKLFLSGYAVQTFELLRHYHLFGELFPMTEEWLGEEREGFPRMFLSRALENTDKRLAEGKPVTPYFLFAAFLWDSVRTLAEAEIVQGVSESIAYQKASGVVLERQIECIAFPRRIALPMREVWCLQPRFNRITGIRPFRLLSHPRFRAAYDFMLLRCETGEVDAEVAAWWSRFQEADEAERKRMTRQSNRRQPRRGRGKKPENRQLPPTPS